MKQKVNTLLAVVEHSAATVLTAVREYATFFKTKQGMFLGQKNTYIPREGYPEDPTKAGITRVATTVDEKFEWLLPQLKEHYKNVFSIEATNSSGAATVELKVGNKSFGKLTALELMRLKNILTSKDLDDMYKVIPVRSDSSVWEKSKNSDYEGRAIFETPQVSGVTKTTEITEEILVDPNLDPTHLPANYRPAITQKRKTVEIGDYTIQKFSGEWNQQQRAELLKRKSELLAAVIEALKEVNDIEVKPAKLDVDAMFDFIHTGK